MGTSAGPVTARTGGEAGTRAPRRLAILQQDAQVRRALVEAFERAGYVTLAGGRGTEVLERLTGFEPHAIVLDMLLPELDGLEFLARLRAHPIRRRIPVFVMSDLADSLVDCIDPEAAKAIGVAAIVPKSIAVAALLRQVDRTLEAGVPEGAASRTS